MQVKTNEIQLPSFLKSSDATGDISITLTLDSQPSASYTLISDGKFPETYTNNQKKYNIYSCYYRVQNASETIDVATGKHLLNVSLEGYYRPLLEKEVVIGEGSSRDYNLTTVASKVNVPVNNAGKTRKIYEPRITTLGSEISQYASEEGYSVVYDTKVRLINAGRTGTMTIQPEDVLEININHKQEHVHNFIFLPQYLEFEKEEEQDPSEAESQKPIFERVPQPVRLIENDPQNASISPVTGRIMSLDMNFDMSGETKTKELTTYQGEKIIFKQVDTYGFAYTTDSAAQSLNDLFEFSGSYEQYWKKVESYSIQYNYDDNYYVGYDKVGWRLGRLQQETNGFETLEASFSNDADIVREASFYKFKRIALVEYERFDLEAYYNYYDDAMPTFDEMYITYEEYDDRTRSVVTKYERNKEYFPPMFVKRRVVYSRCLDWAYVPESLADYSKQIVSTGEEKKEVYNVDIKPSKNTGIGFLSISGVGYDSDVEDSYDEYNEITSTQDSEFKNSIKEVQTSSVQGRPGGAETYATYQRVEKNASTQTGTNNNGKWKVYSPTTGNLTPRGTVTISGVNSIREAFDKLKKQLQNSRKFEGDEVTVTTFFKSSVSPGDKLMVSSDGVSFVGVIKTVNHNIKILGEDSATGLTTITASIVIRQPVQLRLSKEVETPKPGLFVPIPNKKYHTEEADLLVSSLPKRGDFL